MTPNLTTVVSYVNSTYSFDHVGVTNCRPISGSSTWSQHAWSNAADLHATPTVLDRVHADLETRYGPHIAHMLWRVPDHYDHIHVDMWPTGYGIPPCAGGSLRVKHADGRIGRTFTDDIGDDMPLTDEDIRKIWDAAPLDVIAQKVWYFLITDDVTAQKRGAAFHLAAARRDAHTAASAGGVAPANIQDISDGVANRVADTLAERLKT